jgi:hypothetical protein
MTFDLEAAKRLAQQLAGDVLNQIERDGSVNRENIAGHLLAGLVLEAAHKPSAVRFLTRDNLYKIEEIGISEEFPLTVARPPTEYRVITGRPGDGSVHLVCRCEECQRRRKLSLCGCEMCAHHSEAAAIVAGEAQAIGDRLSTTEARQIVERRSAWNAQKEYLAKIAQRRAMREMYVGDPGVEDMQTVDVKLWRMENGERVHILPSAELVQALRGAIEDNSPHEMINPDRVVFPNGRVMSGLEIFQTGRTPAQIWAATPWPAALKNRPSNREPKT